MNAAIEDPGCSIDADRELAELLDQVSRKLQSGEPVDWDGLAREHPRHAVRLKSLSPALHMLADMGLELGAGTVTQMTDRSTGLGVLGDYRILREVGRGGMAIVYEADQISLGRRVALKVLPFAAVLDPRQLQRFKNEAQAAAQIQHQNIVPVYSIGSERGVHYYAMQYIEGQTLAELIRNLRTVEGRESPRTGPPTSRDEWRQGTGEVIADQIVVDPLASTQATDERSAITEYRARHATPPHAAFSTERSTNSREYFRTIARLGMQAAGALDHAHSLGLVHRDVKPGNLMLDILGNLWITDFGLARFRAETGHSLTMTGDLVGTLRYMSPEQALAKRVIVDHRTDIYSLGVTLYELTTLQPPFDGRDRQEVLRKIAFDEPLAPRLINKSVPTELETILLKAMEKKPDDRYATATELAEDLGSFLDDRPIRAKRPTLVQRARKWGRRHQVIVWSAAVSASLLLVMTVAALSVSNVLINRQKQRVVSEKEKAERAERESKHRLFDARLAQARASRYSPQVGRRFESWRAVTEAAELARELALGQDRLLALRNEAIGCMALTDVQPIREPWEGFPPGSSSAFGFDAELERYARSDEMGNVTVHRVADDEELARLPGGGYGDFKLGAATISFSPKGDLLAVTHWGSLPGQPHQFRLWDWRRGSIAFQAPFRINWAAMTFSPDGSRLALGQNDGTLTIHEVPSGKEVQRIPLGLAPSHLAFHPNGGKIAVASGQSGEVQVREIPTGNIVRKLDAPAFLWNLAWHPDGVLLAAGCEDKNAYLWDTTTGRQFTVLKGHRGSVVGVGFSPDGDVLLSCAFDGSSRLWDPWTGLELLRFTGTPSRFSRDGRRLASLTGHDVTLWEVTSSRECRSLPRHPASGNEDRNAGGVSPDSRWLVIASNAGVRLWDLAASREMDVLPLSRTFDAKFDRSGSALFTSGSAGLYRWPVHAQTGSLRIGPAEKLPVSGPLRRMSLDRQGRILAVADGRGGSVLDLDNLSGKPKTLHHKNAGSVAVSPDGRWIATGTQHGHGVKVWDAHSGKLVHDLIPQARVSAVVFSPDGRWLVTTVDTTVEIWESESWQRLHTIRTGPNGNNTTVFAPDGKVLAVLLSYTVVQLLDTATWQPLGTFEVPDTDLTYWMGFTPVGSQLIVSARSGAICIWDLRLIRDRLREIGLDWDLPPYPPAQPLDGVEPVTVELDLGEFPAVQRTNEPEDEELHRFRTEAESKEET